MVYVFFGRWFVFWFFFLVIKFFWVVFQAFGRREGEVNQVLQNKTCLYNVPKCNNNLKNQFQFYSSTY